MAHPALKDVSASRSKRHYPAGAVEGKRTALRLDRPKGGKVDISSWRAPGEKNFVSEDWQNGPKRQTTLPVDQAPGGKPPPLPRADGGAVTERASGGGIHIKPSHKGLLHKDLGVPEDQNIPKAKMEKAKAHAGPALKKRIVFAENFGGKR